MTVILDQAKHSPGDCAINPVSGCAGEQSQILILAYTSGCMRSAKNHLLNRLQIWFLADEPNNVRRDSELIRNDELAFYPKLLLHSLLLPG